jgi:FtsP/CotA-like multicopper oxidase with cupredoxin domain
VIGSWIAVAVIAGAWSRLGDAQVAPDYRVDRPNGTTVNIDLTATEAVQEIAPDVKYHVWTFDGTTPAPVIRVQLGDVVAGPTVTTYHVPELQPGTYFFRCDIHPDTMHGTFVAADRPRAGVEHD